MSETKLKEFKRETVDRVYRELLDRVKNIIENRNDYIMYIDNLCIFGSYHNYINLL